jgi:hypothetical protein
MLELGTRFSVVLAAAALVAGCGAAGPDPAASALDAAAPPNDPALDPRSDAGLGASAPAAPDAGPPPTCDPLDHGAKADGKT